MKNRVLLFLLLGLFPLGSQAQLQLGPMIGTSYLRTGIPLPVYQLGIALQQGKYGGYLSWDQISFFSGLDFRNMPHGLSLGYHYCLWELPQGVKLQAQVNGQYFAYFDLGYRHARDAREATDGSLYDVWMASVGLNVEVPLGGQWQVALFGGGGYVDSRHFYFRLNRWYQNSATPYLQLQTRLTYLFSWPKKP